MRFIVVVVSMCAFTAPVLADVGVGAIVGNEEAVLFPIRLSKVIIEPSLGYHEADVATTSTEGYTVGVGVFGVSMRGNDVSIYYGARLADISDESSNTAIDPITGVPIAQSEAEIDGYRIAPTVGFQYTLNRVAIGAEVGWAYQEVDQVVSFGAFSTERTTVAKGTFANVVFRFFF